MVASIDPRSHVHLIYDLSEEYSIECVRLFNRMRAMTGAFRTLFSSLSFADDTEFAPLQAADMLAYVSRQMAFAHHAKPIVKRLNEILSQGHNIRRRDLVYRAGSGLGHGVLELPIR